MKIDNVTKGVWTVCIAIVSIIIIGYCTGCKDKPAPVDNLVDVIEQTTKPVEDSLRKEVTQLKLQNDSLIKINQKLSAKKEVFRDQKSESKEKVAAAEQRNDSAAIITALKDELKSAEMYISIADEQVSTQGEIIVNNERIISNQQADIELQKSKFNQLKVAYSIQETQLQDVRAQLTKNVKKLKRAKTWNKILGIGTAAGVGLAALVFL